MILKGFWMKKFIFLCFLIRWKKDGVFSWSDCILFYFLLFVSDRWHPIFDAGLKINSPIFLKKKTSEKVEYLLSSWNEKMFQVFFKSTKRKVLFSFLPLSPHGCLYVCWRRYLKINHLFSNWSKSIQWRSHFPWQKSK